MYLYREIFITVMILFSYLQVWVNSDCVNPDQTPPEGTVQSASALFAILPAYFRDISL